MCMAKRKGCAIYTRKRKIHAGGTRKRMRPENVNRNTGRNNNAKNARVENEKSPQEMFDELIQFFLETISSHDILVDGLKITRKQYGTSEWNRFKDKIIKQATLIKRGKKTIRMTLPDDFAGIYIKVVGDGRGSVHFYAVRKRRDNKFIAANGYPEGGLGKDYSIGLDTQANKSHGLCQTYSLMYYYGAENLLKSGREHYRENIDIGLKWIKNVFLNKEISSGDDEYRIGDTEFTKDSIDDKGKLIGIKMMKNICKLTGTKCDIDDSFNLFDIINILTDYRFKDLLDRWYFDDEGEGELENVEEVEHLDEDMSEEI